MGAGGVDPRVELFPLVCLLLLAAIGLFRNLTLDDGSFTFYSLSDSEATGAVCLDGSPGGFYFYPSSNDDFKDKFILTFEVRK